MKFIKALIAIVLLFVLIGNQTKAQITNDYDKTVNFTTYTTFVFNGWANDSTNQINQLDRNRIEAAFKDEFSSRNLVQVKENADMAVALFAVIKDKTSTTAYTNYYGGRGYRRSFGYGYTSGYSNTTYSERDYREGTVVIDIYDEKEKNLIWQGILRTEVKEKAKKREKSIPENIRKLMYHYPIKPVKN